MILISLQVFPTALYYNRLTGTFEEVEGHDKSGIKETDGEDRPTSPLYGATDEQRERMLQWAQRERLPLFLR